MIRFPKHPVLITWITLTCAISAYTQRTATASIDHMIDSWHMAATRGDSTGFFSRMTPDAIYLGTDAAERWTRTTMARDLGRHFNGVKAWQFEKISRAYTDLGDDDRILFDEILHTWMGPCRGSGIAQRINNQWFIAYYNLSVAVPNDVVREYVKLLPESAVLKGK